MRYKYIPSLWAILLTVIVSGCWTSQIQLVEPSQATDPFGTSAFYIGDLFGERTVLRKTVHNEFYQYPRPDDMGVDEYGHYRFMPFNDSSFLPDESKFIAVAESTQIKEGVLETSYHYGLLSRDGNGIYRTYLPENSDNSTIFTSLTELQTAIREAALAGELAIEDEGPIKPLTRQETVDWALQELSGASAD